MKLVVRILLILILLVLGIGFYLKFKEYPKADMIIGIGVLFFAFILMPAFLYQRYRNKKLADYTLNKEKIDKMIDNLNS